MEKIRLTCIILVLLAFAGCSPAGSRGINADEQESFAVITIEELAMHSSEDDCWVAYEGNVYDFTNAPMHPNMAKTFYSHCGDLSFEAAAKAKHNARSSGERAANFGTFVGVLE